MDWIVYAAHGLQKLSKGAKPIRGAEFIQLSYTVAASIHYCPQKQCVLAHYPHMKGCAVTPITVEVQVREEPWGIVTLFYFLGDTGLITVVCIRGGVGNKMPDPMTRNPPGPP